MSLYYLYHTSLPEMTLSQNSLWGSVWGSGQKVIASDSFGRQLCCQPKAKTSDLALLACFVVNNFKFSLAGMCRKYSKAHIWNWQQPGK
jgi:hypothetical protein